MGGLGQGGAAGAGWGFRGMGTQWTAGGVDLAPFAGRDVYYVVGDAAAVSPEYRLRVPPAPGAAAAIAFVMCEFGDERVGDARKHAHTHTHAHAHAHAHAHMHMHTHMHTHAHTCTLTHTPTGL